MKISELIAELEVLYQVVGDLDCYYLDVDRNEAKPFNFLPEADHLANKRKRETITKFCSSFDSERYDGFERRGAMIVRLM